MRFREFLQDESGQAVLEYMLLLIAVVSVVGLMKAQLKNMTVKLWSFLAGRIAAPCDSCTAGSDFTL